MKNNRKGFTLVELLVVIAIIGLLATIAFLSLNRARSKARDAKRVSDVRQIQSALELFYNDQVTPAYPKTIDPVPLTSTELPAAYLANLPENPTPDDDPATGDAVCTAENYAGEVYTYQSLLSQGGAVCALTSDSGCGSWYQISFCLGGATGGVAAGCNLADPAGMTAGTCL